MSSISMSKFSNIQNIAFDDNLMYINTTKQYHSNTEQHIGSVIQNMIYFGYVPSSELYKMLHHIDLVVFHENLTKLYYNLYGMPKDIIEGVVYKNFPQEVLDMSEGEYWINQILMYLGVPKENFAQDAEQRQINIDFDNLKVLDVLHNPIAYSVDKFKSLCASKSEWTETEKNKVAALAHYVVSLNFNDNEVKQSLNLAYLTSILFKEIEIEVLAKMLKNWTNVLRMYAVLSENSPRLNVKFKYKSLSNQLRRKMLNLFELTYSDFSIDDIIRRKYQFLAAFKMLHIGKYKTKYPQTFLLVNNVRGKCDVRTTQSKIVNAPNGFKLLKSRPKEFLQSYNQLASKVSEVDMIDMLTSVVTELSVMDLLFFVKYLKLYPTKTKKITLPKSKWEKFKFIEHKNNMSKSLINSTIDIVESELVSKLNVKFPNGIFVPENEMSKLGNIKLQINKQNSSSTKYTTGTVLDIPNKIKTIRTCSYWTGDTNIWFDNGFLFLDDTLDNVSSLAWNNTHLENKKFAIFSGDPVLGTPSSNGKATQLIDVNIDNIKSKYRYGVWNILCFSRITFKTHHANTDSYPKGLLQLLENPTEGNLIEPSKVTISLDLTSDTLTSYLMLFDFKKRTMMYLDLPLGGNVSSCYNNTEFAKSYVEAVLSYIEYIPSYADLLSYCTIVNPSKVDVRDNSDIPTLVFDDTEVSEINTGIYYLLHRKNESIDIQHKSIYDFTKDYQL